MGVYGVCAVQGVSEAQFEDVIMETFTTISTHDRVVELKVPDTPSPPYPHNCLPSEVPRLHCTPNIFNCFIVHHCTTTRVFVTDLLFDTPLTLFHVRVWCAQPGGADLPVTFHNRCEYADLVEAFRLNEFTLQVCPSSDYDSQP